MNTVQDHDTILELDDADLILDDPSPEPMTPEMMLKVIKASPWEKGAQNPNSVPFIPGTRLPFCF